MSRIKTREKGKDIKVLDKSAVVGQRMKNAFIRSKRNAAALMDDRQTTPNEYAEDKVEFAADDLAHDTANVAVSGTKTAVRQGRKLFQRQREKRAAEKLRENTAPTEQLPASEPPQGMAPESQPPQRHSGTAPEERLPRQRTDPPRDGQRPRQGTAPAQDRRLPRQRTNTAPERQSFPRYERRLERPPACADVERPADTVGSIVERGRTFAKKQAAKWAERKRQVKNRAVQSDRPPQVKPQATAKVPRQVETAVNTVDTPVKMAKRPAQAMGQTAKATGRSAKGTIKSAQRTVKTAQRTAKGTIKTAQRTSKTAIKTADHTAKAAKMTAHAACAAAKTAAATAKAAAKGVSATIEAMIASVKALVAAIAAGGWVAILAIVIICLIGLIVGSCFGIFFSGEDSGSGQTMPTVVREINQDYEGKLEEIKNGPTHDALEISGSRAVWPEVLAIYAVKTTTDPDNPQEVATMDDSKKELLKEIFWAMNEISHRSETATTTQTVETDDGTGNIVEEEAEVTTTTLYITVTHKTADEMADAYNFTADQRAQLAELLAEENRSMWSSALYGIGVGDGEIVVVALSQLGNVGGQPYWSWYGFNSRVEWCACFVSWCANECGYLDAGVIPKTAGCISGSNWFKDRGLWQDNSYEPRPGDIIYFDWDNKGSSGPQDGLADHVGIVEKVENGIVYTVEGNSGDSCRENRYAIGHYEIYGYGTPAY
ncbi:CHAP domain-containing protein [uncultured Oscillibacter sp.]|uniref:CHAP domain-containing protein n=1 Tax=uncultured Oscillibacter sp. TaxID=876091 RepID=UPI002606364B|nr:CHAP domain-containing protein [uncultured Oscillibacter sp.]